MMEQIKIISDGNSYATQVLDCDGRPIKGITKLEIVVEPTGLVTAMLTFDNVILEMIAQTNLGQDSKQDGSE